MKTIEERAVDAGILSQYMAEYPYDKRSVELGYMAGAYDQKAIDIDTACDWLESHFRDIENPDFYSKRNHPTDLESMYHWSVKELVDDFRKAMEE